MLQGARSAALQISVAAVRRADVGREEGLHAEFGDVLDRSYVGFGRVVELPHELLEAPRVGLRQLPARDHGHFRIGEGLEEPLDVEAVDRQGVLGHEEDEIPGGFHERGVTRAAVVELGTRYRKRSGAEAFCDVGRAVF